MSIAKQIQDYSDYYVSSAGNVWREKSNGTYLRLRPSKQGLVSLFTNGKAKPMYIYRLVAQAFVPIPSKYADIPIDELDVHHIDHNRKNSIASNLQWLTKAEHMQLHSESEVTFARRSAAKKGEKHPMFGKPRAEGAGKQPKQVVQYTKKGDFVAEYASIHEAERLTNIAHQNICKCCSGKLKSTGGYKWAYLE